MRTAARSHKIICILTAMLIACVAMGQTSSSHGPNRTVRVADDDATAVISKAETALDKKDYAVAEPLLKEAVSSDPHDYRAWFDLGFLYNATGRKQEAIAAYRHSVDSNPQLFESTLNLGLMLAQSHDPEAEKYLRAATQLKPTAKPEEGLERAWFSLGQVIGNKDIPGALAAFAQAGNLQQKDPEPHLAAGALLERQGKSAEAEQEFAKALELDSKSADAALGLADIYRRTDRLPDAEAMLRKYIELEPQNAAAHFQLGWVLVAEHKRFEAIDAYEAGVKLQPGDVKAEGELGSLYDISHQFDKAEALFRSILSSHADDADIHAGLGVVLLHERKAEAAQSELLRAVELNPKLGDAYGDLALAASELKNYSLTVRALDARAKLLPEIPGTCFLRATAYDHLRDRQHAAEYYRQFLSLANGRFPDQEWQAKRRLKLLDSNQ